MKKIIISLVLLTLICFSATPSTAGFLTGKTWTKYPVVLIPGVFDWDNILGMNINYFYQIEEAIEKKAYNLKARPFRQKTHFIPLNPWQNTHDRAIDLKNKLDELMAKHGYEKVNVIAHSHGATTSRLAIRWMVEEAASLNQQTPIASLTSISGPHKGTPTADYYMANEAPLLAGLLDFAGNFMVIASGMFEYVGNQSSADVFKDFSQPEITKFNQVYPSAGVPEGGGIYGEGAASNGSFAGDGLGNAMDPEDPDSILYYSWAGNIGDGWSTAVDPGDLIMMATNYMNLEQGYTGDADGFIPVSSARFGKFLSEYYWNHIDEMNQLIGIVNGDAASPKEVFRQHANRLQKAGR